MGLRPVAREVLEVLEAPRLARQAAATPFRPHGPCGNLNRPGCAGPVSQGASLRALDTGIGFAAGVPHRLEEGPEDVLGRHAEVLNLDPHLHLLLDGSLGPFDG